MGERGHAWRPDPEEVNARAVFVNAADPRAAPGLRPSASGTEGVSLPALSSANTLATAVPRPKGAGSTLLLPEAASPG